MSSQSCQGREQPARGLQLHQSFRLDCLIIGAAGATGLWSTSQVEGTSPTAPSPSSEASGQICETMESCQVQPAASISSMSNLSSSPSDTEHRELMLSVERLNPLPLLVFVEPVLVVEHNDRLHSSALFTSDS